MLIPNSSPESPQRAAWSAAPAGSPARPRREASSGGSSVDTVLHQRVGELEDVAGADRDQKVALAQPRRQRAVGPVGVDKPPDRAARGVVGNRAGDREA